MDFLRQIREAFQNLLSAKLRSLLAILGILVGTGSVVALISSGQLATQAALKQFKNLGTNIISMSANMGGSSSNQSDRLTVALLDKLQQVNQNITSVIPYGMSYVNVDYNGQNIDGQVVGATEAMQPVLKLHLNSGRFVSFLDSDEHFAIIGSNIAKQLKDKAYVYQPVGKELQVGNSFYQIIGTLKPWPENVFVSADMNDSLLVPLKAMEELSKYATISNVIFKVKKGADLQALQEQIKAFMRENLPSMQVRFRSPVSLIKVMSKQHETFTWLLTAIGSISLIVGGIGVMNIMLVSVVERRREIGIRMAIGAKRSDIRWMFVIESVALTFFGGLLGVALGVLASFVLATAAGWDFHLFIVPPMVGFGVSVLVGMLSGFYPAYAASKLDVIIALEG